jgi:hypothetical protein
VRTGVSGQWRAAECAEKRESSLPSAPKGKRRRTAASPVRAWRLGGLRASRALLFAGAGARSCFHCKRVAVPSRSERAAAPVPVQPAPERVAAIAGGRAAPFTPPTPRRAFLSRQQHHAVDFRLVFSCKMAQSHAHVVARIRKSTAETRDLQSGAMDVDASGTEAHLEQTVRELQARVDEQQAVLERVRAPCRTTKDHLLMRESYAAPRRSTYSKQLTRLATHVRS